MPERARYDAIADWYDEYTGGPKGRVTRIVGETLTRLLGSGPGRCLDLCCGGGVHAPVLLSAGWTVVGVDQSSEQLRIARARLGRAVELVQADAHELPFPDASFDSVAAAFVHGDVNDLRRVLVEATRILRPGGGLVHVGSHPCFVGPSVESHDGDRRILHTGYRREGWTSSGIGIGQGIRSRVGVNHVTLATFLNAVTAAGLTIEQVAEPGDDDPPILLATRARKPG